MNRSSNSRVRPAPAEVARHRAIDVIVGRPSHRAKERHGRHDLSRLAIATLRHAHLFPRALHRMIPVGRKPLDRRDFTVDRRDRQKTAPHRTPRNQHGARPALPETAAVFGPRASEHVAQHPEKGHVVLDVEHVLDSVDEEMMYRHGTAPSDEHKTL